MPQDITLQPGESVTIRAAQGTSPPVTPPTQPPVTPPTNPEPPSAGGIFLGNLSFTGERFATQDAGAPPPYVYVTFHIPAGFDGKVSRIEFSEYGSTGRFRTVVFSKTPGDFATPFPGLQLGTSGNIGVAFNKDEGGCVRVVPGEVWHLSLRCTYEDGRPTAGPPLGIQIIPGAPS